MQIVFVVIAISGLCYYLLGKRQFDFFSLGFLSSCVYFLPGFYGFVQRPVGDYQEPIPTDLHDDMYIVMSIILGTVFLAGWVFSSTSTASPPKLERWFDLLPGHPIMVVALIISFVAWFMCLLDLGWYFSILDKAELLGKLTRWKDLMAMGGTIAFVLAVLIRSRMGFILSIIILVFEMAFNTRTTAALAIIAVLMAVLATKPPSRILVTQWKTVLLSAVAVTCFFAWQQLFPLFQQGNWSGLQEAALSPESYVKSVENSEPFITQAILNEVIISGYTIPPEHFFTPLCAFVPFYNEIFGELLSFNDRFSPDLFPGMIVYGIANNPWAEAISGGSWFLLMVFLLGYVSALWIGSRCVRSTNATFASVSSIFFAYLAFYLHRNDLLFQIVLQKRILIVFAFCAVIAFFLKPSRFAPALKRPPAQKLGARA